MTYRARCQGRRWRKAWRKRQRELVFTAENAVQFFRQFNIQAVNVLYYVNWKTDVTPEGDIDITRALPAAFAALESAK